MLFTLPVFFTAVFLFDLKVIIGTVIIEDLIIPLTHEMAVFIDFCLDQVAFSAENIQCTVYIMEFLGMFFQELRCSLIGRTLAAGLQYPCIDQVGKDRVDVIFKFISLFQFPTDLIHLHLIID